MRQVTLRLSWASQRRLARELEGFRLTVPQYMALRALQCGDRQGCMMSELAEASQQVSATMTGIIDRLAEHGLVERRPDPYDRRALRVSLTQDGHDLLAQIERLGQARLARTLESFTHAERKQIIGLMQAYLQVVLAELDPRL
ncbi:MAG: MarR family transcriptional regulator [Anaerolineales bacterium]|nr:MarR family transcriptional regulator [Anaerolineales bacterium]